MKPEQESPKHKAKHSEGQEDKEALSEILNFIETTDLEYVEILKNGQKISFRRAGLAIPKKEAGETAEKEKEETEPKLFAIRSPIVGRFYSSTGADRPPLVVEGARITAGQRVAIVEAMKIKKEVFSAVSGKVKKIFVRDGDPVEYGQELFSVEPETESNQ